MKQIAFRAWRESHSPYSCADAYSYAVQCARRMPYEVRMYQVGAEMFACGEMRAAHACMPPQRACCWCTLACNLGYKNISKNCRHDRVPVSADRERIIRRAPGMCACRSTAPSMGGAIQAFELWLSFTLRT